MRLGFALFYSAVRILAPTRADGTIFTISDVDSNESKIDVNQAVGSTRYRVQLVSPQGADGVIPGRGRLHRRAPWLRRVAITHLRHFAGRKPGRSGLAAFGQSRHEAGRRLPGRPISAGRGAQGPS